ncbi:hypothetical protein [Pseudomonas kribbensis]|uniref:Uncharacterized protein n=1 Tax=Pseudomonas kribbensis TaxID=1628086 RepID=A0A4Y8VN98_9PSED|nr:hypothetical protein [Pseudomonas kribbensis]TFH81781.1 hypothetical protein E4J90_09380 [Pseudomonas kribbensis]
MSEDFEKIRELFIEAAVDFTDAAESYDFLSDDFLKVQNEVIGLLSMISAVGMSRKFKSEEELFNLSLDLGGFVLGPLIRVQDHLAEISGKRPEAVKDFSEFIFSIAQLFFIPSQNLKRRYRSENAAFKSSLAVVNEIKDAVRERARTIADEKWKSDAKKKEYPRLSDMAVYVRTRLEGEGWSEDMPKTLETIKGWLRPMAPAYAKQPGRSPKSS